MSNDSSKENQEDPHNSARKASFGNPWLVVSIALATFFISQFAAALILGIGLALFRPEATISELLYQSAPTQFFYVLIAEGLVLALTIAVVKRWRNLGLSSIGLGRLPKWRDLTRALGGAVVFYGLLIISSILITLFVPDLDTDELQDVGFDALNSSLDTLLAFTALVILPPIGEETLMRGYLYSGLRSKMRFVPAMLITSVLFGIAHLGTGSSGAPLWIAGVNTFLLSLVLVYLRERTGALYAPMLVHATNNLIAFGIHFR
ncbi:CPBP family intramembrane metalloprotease [Candidatus Saccharibacteria bacterium]|nr:CPBP family intramembrane metalloprotease [Candidatus Saccharibacteria bacterium]MBI2285705.1 CPBP family intramembrane metalloprotease [Candidatus Saccharibacteria bacterium]